MSNNKKQILITGATGGIGTELCQYLIKLGYVLIITARSEKSLKELRTRLLSLISDAQVEYKVADFGNINSLLELAATVGEKLDGLVLMLPQPVSTTSSMPEADTWHKIFNNSFINPLELIQALLPPMKKAKAAKVVVVSGITSVQVMPNYVTSSVLRAAWLAQAKAMAHNFAEFGIRVNTLSLGGVMTDRVRVKINREAQEQGKTFEELYAKRVDNIPLKKYATPLEVAKIIENLLSGFSDHMTGTNIICDGGFVKSY